MLTFATLYGTRRAGQDHHWGRQGWNSAVEPQEKQGKAVLQHTYEGSGGRGGIVPTHS
jgi:hypothetical protein